MSTYASLSPLQDPYSAFSTALSHCQCLARIWPFICRRPGARVRGRWEADVLLASPKRQTIDLTSASSAFESSTTGYSRTMARQC